MLIFLLRVYKWTGCSLQVQSFCWSLSLFTYANMWMGPNWAIVHANRWLSRQLPNLHEQMEVVHIQNAGGTWILSKQAALLKAVETWTLSSQYCLTHRKCQSLKLHKRNVTFDRSWHSNDQIFDKFIFRKCHEEEVLISAISSHIPDFFFLRGGAYPAVLSGFS